MYNLYISNRKLRTRPEKQCEPEGKGEYNTITNNNNNDVYLLRHGALMRTQSVHLKPYVKDTSNGKGPKWKCDQKIKRALPLWTATSIC